MRNYGKGKGKRENKTTSFLLVSYFFIQSVMVISISYKINVFIYEANMNIPDDGLFNYKRILILIVKRDTPNSTKKRIRHCVY